MKRLGVLVAIVGIAAAAMVLPRLGGVAATPAVFDRNITLNMATEQSDESGKPVLAFVTADWCGSCQKMKRHTLSNSEVESFIRREFIAVYVDADNDRRDALELGNVRYLPTSVVRLGAHEITRFEGEQKASAYLAWLRSAVEEAHRRLVMTED
ncbi:MAG: thioredoxin family protein [Phycisphaeraceae bacterium]|nr:thioredoxin family protein [Phycisphaeraceae bacterium]MCW5763330.1 thioredoxin family protein [Phycisphaeraceae bacterium]